VKRGIALGQGQMKWTWIRFEAPWFIPVLVHSVTSVQQSAEPQRFRHQMHNRTHAIARLQTHSTHMRTIPRTCHIAFKSKMGSLGLAADLCQEYAHATQFKGFVFHSVFKHSWICISHVRFCGLWPETARKHLATHLGDSLTSD